MSGNEGGGIRGRGRGSLILVNSTITGNRGSGSGGISVEEGSTAQMVNTMIFGNYAWLGESCGRGFQVNIISKGHNLLAGMLICDLELGTGDLLGADAGLGPLQDNGGSTFTHALLPGSRAIDAGDSASCLATDQRGVSRPQGAAYDIGAYER